MSGDVVNLYPTAMKRQKKKKEMKRKKREIIVFDPFLAETAHKSEVIIIINNGINRHNNNNNCGKSNLNYSLQIIQMFYVSHYRNNINSNINNEYFYSLICYYFLLILFCC